jgi:hypothetical protein
MYFFIFLCLLVCNGRSILYYAKVVKYFLKKIFFILQKLQKKIIFNGKRPLFAGQPRPHPVAHPLPSRFVPGRRSAWDLFFKRRTGRSRTQAEGAGCEAGRAVPPS